MENNKIKKAIERVEKGEFREYWLQYYIKNKYRKLGFEEIEGPFEWGYDFKGIYKRKKVVVEAERKPYNFILHDHNKKDVDILIIETDDETDRKLLPEKIIIIDPEDFIKSTHEVRKRYAIRKRGEEKLENKIRPFRILFYRIKSAFYNLWIIKRNDLPLEETPEADALEGVIGLVTHLYLNIYDIDPKDLIEKKYFTNIETLTNSLIKSKKDFESLKINQKDFLNEWYELIVEIYNYFT